MDTKFENNFRSKATLQFKVEKVSELIVGVPSTSETTYVRNLPWGIKVLTNWLGGAKCLSVYLSGENKSKFKWSCDVKFTIKLINQKYSDKDVLGTYSHCFTFTSNCHGSFSFIDFNKLTDPRNGFIVNDSIILKLDMTAGIPINDALSTDTLYEILDKNGKILEATQKELSAYKNKSDVLRNKYIEAVVEIRKKYAYMDECLSFSEKEDSSDVIIKTSDGKKLFAHRIVLRARSPAFAKLLDKHGSGNNKEPTKIFISGIDFFMMHKILIYIYTGKIDLEEKNVFDILKAAEKFELDEVKEEVSAFLSKKLKNIEADIQDKSQDTLESGTDAMELSPGTSQGVTVLKVKVTKID